MCLAVPVQVIEVLEDKKAKVEISGLQIVVSSMLVTDLKVGDYVLIHAGFIIEKLTEKEANIRLELFSEYYDVTGK